MGLCNSKPTAGSGRGTTRTSSPIISETQTGSLTMKFACYSETKGIGVGNSINSSKFTVGGHSWYISYFPDGEKQDTADWVAVFLNYQDTRRPAAAAPPPHDGGDDGDVVVVTAAFEFSLLDGDCQNQQVVGSSPAAGVPFVSFADGYSNEPHGFNKFIKRKKLASLWWCSRRLGGEAFHIRCDVTVLKTHRHRHGHRRAVEVPTSSSELRRNLGDILATGDGADVCFMVAGEPFLAHRSVLAARSSFLKEVLLGPGKETAGKCLEVKNVDPSVFRAMLHFIYTDTLPHIKEAHRRWVAQGLLAAADTFKIERLKLLSEDMLRNGIELHLRVDAC